MKDLSLSFLSRGCGRLVSSNRNTRSHDGRLDVCFTPQDYYIWKSKETLLRLSNSGHLFAEAESTLPKTYSTRRGALLLYSQEFVAMEAKRGLKTGSRKKRVVPRYTEQVEKQLNTLKELTAAILNYSHNQYISSRVAPSLFPHVPPVPKLQCPSLSSVHTKPTQPDREYLVQQNKQWLSAEGNDKQENQPGDLKMKLSADKDEVQDSRKRVRLDLFLQIPRTSRTPTPQMESQPWVHYVGMTPEEPEEPHIYVDNSMQHTEINHYSIEGELHHPKINAGHDVGDDQGCSKQDNKSTGDKDNHKRSISGNRPRKIGKAEQQTNINPISGQLLHPVTVGRLVCSPVPCWEKTDLPRSKELSHGQGLPPIVEGCTISPGLPVQAQTQQDAQPPAERVQFQSQENPKRLQQPLLLPLLFSEKEEQTNVKHKGGRGKTERQFFKKDAVGKEAGGGGGGRLPPGKGSGILLEAEEEPLPPVGVLGCVAGYKGPGRQSSFAFLQNRLNNLQDPSEMSDANRGVIRGVVPLELRALITGDVLNLQSVADCVLCSAVDFQDGRSAGCLIMGPDGEIIQLSLYDTSQDPSQGDADTKQKALQVLSSEGEELPWVIVLQPDHTNTEGVVELNTHIPAGDTQHHLSMYEGAEGPRPVEQSFSTEQILDLYRSSEARTCSPSSHTDPVAVSKKKTKTSEAVMKMWKDPKNNIRMPSQREQAEKLKLGGDNTEEEEIEDLPKTGQNGYLHRSQQQLGEKLKSISPTEATTMDAVDKRRKNSRRLDTDEAAITKGKGDVKNAESNGQNTIRLRKEGRRQRQKSGSRDVQSVRSQKQEVQSNRGAGDTQDHPALPSVRKKKKDKKGGEGDVKMSEEEGFAGRKRSRGRLKRNELATGSPKELLDNKEMETDEEKQEESQQKSTPRLLARQKPDNNPTTDEDADPDHLSTPDKHSGVQTVSSLRSTAASSQFNPRSSRKSFTSSWEETVAASAAGIASSRGRLSSCSTVMVTEEQLMLNPMKTEFSRSRQIQEEEEAAALRLAQRAERRRQQVEKKRREREEEERKQQEREQTEGRMRNQLEEERRKRVEEQRLKKLAEEEERKRREKEEEERVRREQAQKEREKRRQEEWRRQMERLHRMREEEEQKKKAELERLRLEEEKKQEEESKKLQEMDEAERVEYLHKKEQEEKEEEERRNEEEEQKRREREANLLAVDEARLQAELLTRQMERLQQDLAFKRGLMLESEGLENTQGISRPWIYSYFALFPLLGLDPSKAKTTTP